MEQTINAVVELADEIFQNDSVFFLMTRCLNQDKLENAFSIFRQKGVNNTNPSIAEFNNILSRLMTAKIIQKSCNSNCEEFNDNTVEILSTVISEEHQHVDGKENDVNLIEKVDRNLEEQFVDSFMDDFLHTNEIGGDSTSLRYFVGYVAFKILARINCETCAAELTKDGEEISAPTELFIFHKNYSSLKDFGNLVAPSDTFFSACKVHVAIFEIIFNDNPQTSNIKSTIVKKCINSTVEWFATCSDHKVQIVDFFILILLRKHCIWKTMDEDTPPRNKLKIITDKDTKTSKKLKIING